MATRATPTDYNVVRSGTVLYDFNDHTHFTGATRAADTTYFKEGTQSMKVSGATNGSRIQMTFIETKLGAAWDFSGGGVIKIRVYCENLGASTITLRLSRTDTGVPGNNLGFYWNRSTLQDGWNELLIHTNDSTAKPITHLMAAPYSQAGNWSVFGATDDFSQPIESFSFDLASPADNTAVFYFDAIEFTPRSRPKIIFGFDSIGQTLYEDTFADFQVDDGAGGTENGNILDFMAERNMAGYLAVGGVSGAGQFQGASKTRTDAYYAAGWDVIGHTTVTHPDLTTLSDAEIIAEVQTNMDAIAELGYARGVDYFAYPYNSTDATVVSVLNGMGIKTARGGSSRAMSTSQYGFLNPLWFGSFSINGSSVSSADAIEAVDSAILYGTSLWFFGHEIKVAEDSTSWDPTKMQELIDYIHLKVNQGLLDVVTPSQWYDGLTAPRLTASRVAT